ncbi:MAG: hypothetical protein E7390_06385 [Ruminococcaceae bacterium]|nr:hypothetical protein [Oscillospiraceae bacterium]
MNDRLRQIITIAFGIPIGLAIAASIALALYYLQGTARTLGILALFAVGIALLVGMAVRNSKGNKLVERLLDILYKEADPETFIAESLSALEKTKNRALRNTLSLNLAVGYAAAGKHTEAIEVMKNMPISSADKVSKAMYYCNAAAFYAEKGASVEAHETYNLGKPFFEKAGDKLPLSYLRLTRGLLHFAEGEYAEALETLANARSRGFEDRHTMTKLQLFEARALAATGRTKDAKSVYTKIVQKKTYPYLLSCAKKELEQLQNNAK